MFGSLGLPEIVVILLVALLVFGPRRLPEIGRTIGKALGEFRRATTELKRSIDTEVTLEEVRQPPPPVPSPGAAATPAPTPAPSPALGPAPGDIAPPEAPAAEPAEAADPAAAEDQPSD